MSSAADVVPADLREVWPKMRGLVVSEGGTKIDFGASYKDFDLIFTHLDASQLIMVTDAFLISLLSNK